MHFVMCKEYREHVAIAYLGLIQDLRYWVNESANPQTASRHVH